MSLAAPSKLTANVRINIPRIEDKKIERLLAMLAKKIERASQPESTRKRTA
jgi:formiminotetrahydrofolate cyclodeaminase